MKEKLNLQETFAASPAEIYEAWLDGTKHGEMTGAEARGSNQVGATFTAWDGYISGKNLELIKDEKIVQAWRTSEFSEDDEDSLLTLSLKKTPQGTEVTLDHTHIPEGQTQYEQGWIDHYFSPMKEYFGEG